jgi:ATP-dependent RNA helicase RhlE
MLRASFSMGAPGRLPGPRPLDRDPSHALTGARAPREGHRQERLNVTFEHLGLAPDLLRAVADQGYTEPTPVQAAAIPLVLAGRDVLAGAQTGTGKTAAFVLPILQRLHATRPAGPAIDPRDRRAATARPIRVLVLAPTRELAIQVEEAVRTYGAVRPIRSVAIFGGVGFDPQVRALRAGPEIVVATPGRLLDHVGQRTIDLGRVEVLVLDEADRMLDMGFIRDIRRILALLPARRQNLLFSATFSDEIRELADGFLDRPATVEVAPRNQAAELVRQVVHPVDRERKRELLSHLLSSGRLDQSLVFTRTKHGANRLAEQLVRDGHNAAAIHGNKSQGQRTRALADFKAGRVTVLVATDIAARGLDIESLPHVVNFELPMVAQDYVHRIGRTGRAGIVGEAVSLVCVDEARLLGDIETVLRHRIAAEVVPGFEPDRSIRAQPILLRGGGRVVAPGRVGRTPGGAGWAPARRPGVAAAARSNEVRRPVDPRRPVEGQSFGRAWPGRQHDALPGERLSGAARREPGRGGPGAGEPGRGGPGHRPEGAARQAPVGRPSDRRLGRG